MVDRVLLVRVQSMLDELKALRAGVRPSPDAAMWAAVRAAEANVEALRNLVAKRVAEIWATEEIDRRCGS